MKQETGKSKSGPVRRKHSVRIANLTVGKGLAEVLFVWGFFVASLLCLVYLFGLLIFQESFISNLRWAYAVSGKAN